MSEPNTKKLNEPAVTRSEEEEQKEEEEEEAQCNECGRILEMYEADDDGFCLDCHDTVRVDNLRARLPDHMAVRKVSAYHSKPCSDCGRNDWGYGCYWYVFDASQPWGTDKYCLECAEFRFSKCAEDSDEDY